MEAEFKTDFWSVRGRAIAKHPKQSSPVCQNQGHDFAWGFLSQQCQQIFWFLVEKLLQWSCAETPLDIFRFLKKTPWIDKSAKMRTNLDKTSKTIVKGNLKETKNSFWPHWNPTKEWWTRECFLIQPSVWTKEWLRRFGGLWQQTTM